jgi:uncharacterized protein
MPGVGLPLPPEDLSGAWCNSDAIITSLLEAVSFVTPELEDFVVRTVAQGLASQPEHEMARRCRAFLREESNHSRLHRHFNSHLLQYLGKTPPGLGLVRALLAWARGHLSLSSRLLLVAALEHFAAVLSKVYLRHRSGYSFGSASAREMLAQHAIEELGHRSVVFDLWFSQTGAGSVRRAACVLAILLAALAFLSLAVPWILHRKTGARRLAAATTLARVLARNVRHLQAQAPLGELFSFARGDFHPDAPIEASSTDPGKST